ncbi:MAG: putative Ig domain-containing protein [Synergistaceae bacterium]|nr:putative Ig domain-containing protein [Synergistaceae bacterium]
MRRFRLIVLAVMLLAMCGTAWGSVTINAANFPDANFRQYVKNFDDNNNNVLDDDEIRQVRNIIVVNSSITSLKGIEYFTALTQLDCSYNQLTALDLSRNTALTTLNCTSNRLTSLNVGMCINLTTLYCSGNYLAGVDLSKNIVLKYLYCGFNIGMVNGSYEFKLTDFMEAYRISDILGTPNYYDDVYMYYSTYSAIYYNKYSISSLNTSSSGYVLLFPKTTNTLDHIYYRPSNSHLTVFVYPSVASSGGGGSDSDSGEIPLIRTDALDSATVGSQYSCQLSASGASPMTWKVKGNLPDGLVMSTEGLISGISTKKGKKRFTVTVSNANGSDKKTLSITVYELPQIITDTLKNATVGKTYNAVIKKRGTSPLVLSLEGSLPEGMKFNPKNAKITGKPKTIDACGTYTLTFTLLNPVGKATKTFTLDVDAVTPSFTTKSLKTGTYGKPYKAAIKTKGSGPITLTAENLPEGLYLNSETGTIEGTPLEVCTKRTITLTADNGWSSTVHKDFLLTIKAVAPKITTTALPEGTAGSEYSTALYAEGTPDITWSAVNLPAGLGITADGQILGVPRENGRFSVKITAANYAKSVKKTMKLVIHEAPTITDTGTAGSTADVLAVVAVLPEVSADVPGMYDFAVTLSDDAQPGEELVYLAGSSEPSEDDTIAEFADEDGEEIAAVPENRKVTVSVWLRKGVTYKPAIAVKR